MCFHPQIANTHRHSHGEAEPAPSPQLRPRGACCRLAGFNITTASGPAPADSRPPLPGLLSSWADYCRVTAPLRCTLQAGLIDFHVNIVSVQFYDKKKKSPLQARKCRREFFNGLFSFAVVTQNTTSFKRFKKSGKWAKSLLL